MVHSGNKEPCPVNHWTSLSIDLATQKDYLDQLFRVYPMAPEAVRELHVPHWEAVKEAFGGPDNANLFKALMKLKLFPVKDSYQKFFYHYPGAIDRNPATVNRLMGRVRELGLADLEERCRQPKETNRQIGPLFQQWVKRGCLGLAALGPEEFADSTGDAVMIASDAALKEYAASHLGYKGGKGLDLIARCNGKHVLAEAKFVTDFGGHQDRQVEDALKLAQMRSKRFTTAAILDGVVYIPKKNNWHRGFAKRSDDNVLSAILLREFLSSL